MSKLSDKIFDAFGNFIEGSQSSNDSFSVEDEDQE